MSSTGADMNGGSASKRGHQDGSKDRSYTKEQHEAVKRVLACQATDYYEILRIKKDCTETEVKKTYRKLALTMHPDKNSAPQADEAFKRVSKAFQVLSDQNKKRIYDQTGADPEQRGDSSARASAFARAAGGSPFARGGMHGGFDPEDIFSAFFGGGQGFGGSPFGGFGGSPFGGGGTQFGFGGPGGPRVYTFNAGNPFAQFADQARNRAGAERQNAPQEPQTGWQKLLQFLPLLFIIVPYLLSIFSGGDSGSSSAPRFAFDLKPPYTQERATPRFGIPFYVNPKELQNLSAAKIRRLDREAETKYVSILRANCEREHRIQEEMLRNSMGWFSRDEEKYQEALNYPVPHCARLDELGLRLG